MHQLLVLRVACDTVQTAGMTEGAKLGKETNCLHFLRVQPLQGTPMNITEMATNLRLWKIMTRMRASEVKLQKQRDREIVFKLLLLS